MKKVLVLVLLCFTFKCTIAQIDLPNGYTNIEFIKAYKTLALSAGDDGKKYIRKWESDINIFIEGDSLGKIQAAVEKDIAIVNPLLNGIKIKITNDKDEANFLILLSHKGEYYGSANGGYIDRLYWDNSGTIFKCVITINKDIATLSELKLRLKRSMLYSVGAFLCKELVKPVSCNICNITSNTNDFDSKIVKLHYSKFIKTGMTDDELNVALLDSNTISKLKTDKNIYISNSNLFKILYSRTTWIKTIGTAGSEAVFCTKDNSGKGYYHEFKANIAEKDIKDYYRLCFSTNQSYEINSITYKTTEVNGIKVYEVDFDLDGKLKENNRLTFHYKSYLYASPDASFTFSVAATKEMFNYKIKDLLDLLNGISK